MKQGAHLLRFSLLPSAQRDSLKTHTPRPRTHSRGATAIFGPVSTSALPCPAPSSRPDLLLCDAEGVLLDGVTIRPGAARRLDAAHEPLLALLQAQADVLQLGQVRPGHGLILVLCKSETHRTAAQAPRANICPLRSRARLRAGAGISAQMENALIKSSHSGNEPGHREPRRSPRS